MQPRLKKHNANKPFAETRENVGQPNTWLNTLIKFFLFLAKIDNSLSPVVVLEVLKELPVVSSFITGLVMLHQGWEAFKNPKTPQRWTKMGAGIAGGLMSLSLGIMGALILASALVAAPVVLPSITIAVYSTALYRDLYSAHQDRKNLIEIKNKIAALETDHPGPLTLEALKAQEKVLKQNYSRSKTNALISFLIVVGFSLALGAVFATGIGGAVIVGVASAVIMGAMTKRIWDRYKQKQALKKTINSIELEQEGPSEKEKIVEPPQQTNANKLSVGLDQSSHSVVPQADKVPIVMTVAPPANKSPTDAVNDSVVNVPAEVPDASVANVPSRSSRSKVITLLEIPLSNIMADRQKNMPEEKVALPSSMNDSTYADKEIKSKQEDIKSEDSHNYRRTSKVSL